MLIQFGLYDLNHKQSDSDYTIRRGLVVQEKKLWPPLINQGNGTLSCVCCLKMLEMWFFWAKKPSWIT